MRITLYLSMVRSPRVVPSVGEASKDRESLKASLDTAPHLGDIDETLAAESLQQATASHSIDSTPLQQRVARLKHPDTDHKESKEEATQKYQDAHRLVRAILRPYTGSLSSHAFFKSLEKFAYMRIELEHLRKYKETLESRDSEMRNLQQLLQRRDQEKEATASEKKLTTEELSKTRQAIKTLEKERTKYQTDIDMLSKRNEALLEELERYQSANEINPNPLSSLSESFVESSSNIEKKAPACGSPNGTADREQPIAAAGVKPMDQDVSLDQFLDDALESDESDHNDDDADGELTVQSRDVRQMLMEGRENSITKMSVFDRLYSTPTRSSKCHRVVSRPSSDGSSPSHRHANSKRPRRVRLLCSSKYRPKDGLVPMSPQSLGVQSVLRDYNAGTIEPEAAAEALIEAFFHRDFVPGRGWKIDAPSVLSLDGKELLFKVEKRAAWDDGDVCGEASAQCNIQFLPAENEVHVLEYSYYVAG